MDFTEPPSIIRERVFIPGSVYGLEGVLGYSDDHPAKGEVLIIPPHPNFAGNMDNNVVRYLADHLVLHGYCTLRFNFPGIGGSLYRGMKESSFDFWHRIESDQAWGLPKAAARVAWSYLRQAAGCSNHTHQRHVVGYSFGGLVGLLLASELEAEGHALNSVTAVAMPWIERYDYGVLKPVSAPKVFISGTKDFVFHQEVFDDVYRSIEDPKQIIRGNHDHFYRGEEEALLGLVVAAIEASRRTRGGRPERPDSRTNHGECL